jgi:hypothetical protein
MKTHPLRRLSALLAFPLLALLLASAPSPVRAQSNSSGFVKEFGTMWTFDAPPLAYWQETYSFHPDQSWLDHVRLSAVRIPGCSASFVSPDGLVMTNHHCARSCVTAVSPPDTSYQATGFVAQSMADEKHCPGMWADQLQSMADVTARVRAAVTAKDAVRQAEQRDSAISAITDECSKSTGLNCQVVTFYQGGVYSLYRYKRFNDIRLVMAPEEQAAFFGGDPDNFTYPRYDMDISLLRVYEDGKPRTGGDYFRWSANGAAEGDVVFVVGNPGSTGRLLTVAQMEYLRDIVYPATLAGYERMLSVVKKLSARSEADRRRYENTIFGLENSRKAVNGYLTGLLDHDKMARKQAFERDFRNRIEANPTLKVRYGGAWDAIAKALGEERSFSLQNRWYGFGGSQLLRVAGDIVLLPREAALPDSLRLPGYRSERMERVRTMLKRDRDFDLEVERLTLTAQLEAARSELPPNDPFLTAVLGGRTPSAAVAALLDGTKLTDPGVRAALVDGGAAAVNASTDPLIVAARKIAPLNLEVARRERPLEATISNNAELIGRAIFAAYGRSLPPDATFTLRISDGVVKRYPMNGTYAPYKTSFYGLYARAAEFDNEAPWNLVPRWAAAVDKLDLSTPLDFVTTNDIIGGNSGSPLINRNAEIVGLAFDGNIQFLPNRFIFSDDVGRTVAVHSAGIIEALRKVYGAGWIADELQGGR